MPKRRILDRAESAIYLDARSEGQMIKMRDSFPKTNDAQLTAFERRLRFKLPEAYRQFLIEHNGGRPVNKEFVIASRPWNQIEHIHYFCGVGVPEPTLELAYAIDLYGGLPQGVLPIATQDGGAYVCIDLRDRKDNVVFWDYRHFWGTGEWREQDLYPVVPSFEVFLTMLRPATI